MTQLIQAGKQLLDIANNVQYTSAGKVVLDSTGAVKFLRAGKLLFDNNGFLQYIKNGKLYVGKDATLTSYSSDSTGKITTAFEDARTSDMYVPDHNGELHAIPGGTVAFEGARVARNMLDTVDPSVIDSEDVNTWSSLLGGTTAFGDVLTFGTTGAAGRAQERIREAPYGVTYTFAIELSGYAGQQVTIKIQEEYTPHPSTIKTVSLTDTPTTYSVTRTGSVPDAIKFLVSLYGTAGESVTVGRVWVSHGSVPSDYIHISPGDGPKVEFYNTQNGNTVDANGVVTEAVGAPITTPIKMVHAPAATNYADGSNDLSGGPETISLPSTGDYTLSVYGTAAVTVAAGTATGTGFAQATEGNPVTFNLTAAGTVTLTLDSGTLDTVSGAAAKQVENNAFATPFIPTSGATASRDICQIRALYAGAFNQVEGVAYLEWEPGFDAADLGATEYPKLINTDGGSDRIIYLHNHPFLASKSGSTFSTGVFTWVSGTRYHLAVRWKTDSTFQVGQRTSGTAAWTWGGASLYGGSFGLIAAFIKILDLNIYNNKIHNLEILNKDIGTAGIEDRYSLAKVG